MSVLKNSPLERFSRHSISDSKFSANARTNPFDSDDEFDNKQTFKSSGRTPKHSANDAKFAVNDRTNPFDSDDEFDNKRTPKTSGRKFLEPDVLDCKRTPKTTGKKILDRDVLDYKRTPKTSGIKSSELDYNKTPETSGRKSSNPDALDRKRTSNTSGRKSSEPSLFSQDLITNPFDDHEIKDTLSTQTYHDLGARNRYRNDFREAGGFENQTVEELENYAVYKAEETTKTVNDCLKIAEDMRESGTKTLVTLHQQGEQLSRSHMVAADINQDLSKGEKLLGSLGGMFSRTWKPTKTRPISGPVMSRDDPIHTKGNHLEQRERLGLTSSGSKERRSTHTTPTEPTNALQKVEVEKIKQDDALSDLSNILGELKEMAIDMGSEIDRQNKAMNHFEDDVEELNFRVKGANQRARRLLGK